MNSVKNFCICCSFCVNQQKILKNYLGHRSPSFAVWLPGWREVNWAMQAQARTHTCRSTHAKEKPLRCGLSSFRLLHAKTFCKGWKARSRMRLLSQSLLSISKAFSMGAQSRAPSDSETPPCSKIRLDILCRQPW